MDEDLAIIDSNTRNQKIKDFFINNKKIIISIFFVILLIVLSFYSYQIYKDNQREQLSNKYNNAIIQHQNGDETAILSIMKEVIEDKNPTYSPLALYYLLDNNLIDDKKEVNSLFNILINNTSLETEIKNLIIYKKALFNADSIDENSILEILNPLINSDSVWKSHALYLLAEYFYSNQEKQKSKEFFDQILNLENANLDIVKEAQKRLNRDISE
tara:strand:+ start:515 stop:1159 length:645 start_codon:yes stop_codon:yes gene_type:complete